MRKPIRVDATLALSLLLGFSASYWATARPGQDYGGDFAQYISHARNLAQGRPYEETKYVITFPGSIDEMPAVYPPVFPLLLTPVYARYGLNYARLKLVTGAVMLLAALCTFVIARLLGMSAWRAAAAAIGFGCSGEVLIVKDMILSDGTYLLFAGIALAAAIRVEQNGLYKRQPALAAAMVTVPMLLAYGTRAVGLCLFLAFCAHQLYVRRRVNWFNTLVLAGFCAGVFFYTRTVFDSRSYAGAFHFEPRTYLENVGLYLRASYTLWDGSPRPVCYLLLAITLPIATFGWWRRLASRPTILEFYILAALIPPVLLTGYGNARYLLPVFAFFFIYAIEGFEAIARRFRFAPLVRAGFYALLAAGVVLNIAGQPRGPYTEGVEQPNFVALCNYVGQHVSGKALIVSWDPRLLALYTGRPSAWYPEYAPAATLEHYLQTVGDYVVVYAHEWKVQEFTTAIAKNADRFTLEFANSDFKLYRRVAKRPS